MGMWVEICEGSISLRVSQCGVAYSLTINDFFIVIEKRQGEMGICNRNLFWPRKLGSDAHKRMRVENKTDGVVEGITTKEMGNSYICQRLL